MLSPCCLCQRVHQLLTHSQRPAGGNFVGQDRKHFVVVPLDGAFRVKDIAPSIQSLKKAASASGGAVGVGIISMMGYEHTRNELSVSQPRLLLWPGSDKLQACQTKSATCCPCSCGTSLLRCCCALCCMIRHTNPVRTQCTATCMYDMSINGWQECKWYLSVPCSKQKQVFCAMALSMFC